MKQGQKKVTSRTSAKYSTKAEAVDRAKKTLKEEPARAIPGGTRLIKSVREATEILRGEAAPSRAFKLEKGADGRYTRTQLDSAKIQVRNKDSFEKRQVSQAREALGLSQSKFAGMLGVSVDTLQNWEQGRRKPTGAARVLLRIAATHPEVVMEAAA